MKCINCSYDNTADAQFCENCGKPLDKTCPNCGKPVQANAKFCKSCGFKLAGNAAPVAADRLSTLQRAAPAPLQAKLLSTRKQMEGERKLVTVLFADIIGSTALAEKLDPEEWGEIVSGAHARVSAAVYHYEGTIAQLLGDGVLAFFGAPVTHEDDPVRAVNAALELLQGIQAYGDELRNQNRAADFRMRVGLNTGLVVVGNIGTDLHVEYLAVGDTVNLAARLQSAADPDTVLISGNTARQVKHAFDLESRGALELKGKAEPVPAFRVRGPKAVPELARGIEGLSSPLVGRDAEFKRLQECIDRLRQGQGQIVSVTGEAGLGKSRLAAEARHWAYDARGDESDLQWYEGRSLSFDVSTPYAPFVRLLGSLFDLSPADTSAKKYSRIRLKLAQLAAPQTAGALQTAEVDRVGEMAPFLATLLNIELEEDAERVKYLEPPILRGRVFRAVQELCELLTSAKPLVLVLEDLHWADSISLDLVQQLMGLTERVPLMILALYRAQQQEPSWRFHETAERDYRGRYSRLALEPLDEPSSRALVANLLHIEDLPASVRTLILQKAEGNPFFVEEVIRSLLDAHLVIREDGHWRATREIESIALPDTLAGVIAARLDRLDEDTKRTAQSAAVIGREFQHGILAELVPARQALDTALLNLEQRELVREKARLPELTYLFKHALTQETAYATLLLSKRRELHLRVAECLERTDPTRVNAIAHHFLEAQAEARALPYLVEAGARAAHAYATAEAISYFTRALQALNPVSGSAAPDGVDQLALARRIYEGLGDVYMLLNQMPHAVDNYRAMLAYAETHADVPMQVSAHNKLARAVMYLGQFHETEQHLTQAENLAREYTDRIGLAEMYWMRCGICTMTADFGNAVKYLGESVEIGRALDLKEQMAYGMTHLSNTLVFMTRFDDAWQAAQEALKTAHEIGNRLRIAELLAFPVPIYHMHLGDLDTAYRQATEGLQIAVQIGAPFPECLASYTLGLIAQLRGDYQAAVTHFKQGTAAGRASGLTFMEVIPLGALGTAYWQISPRFKDKVLEYHSRALKLLEDPAGMSSGGTSWADLGICALELGNVDYAAELFQKGLTVPTSEMLLNRSRFLLGAALVAFARGQLDDAVRQVDEARVYAEERGMKYLYPTIAAAEGQMSLARGDARHALEQFSRAETLALEMNMRPVVAQARAGAVAALIQLGQGEQAAARQAAARAVVDEIASLFTDEELRALYLENVRDQQHTLADMVTE